MSEENGKTTAVRRGPFEISSDARILYNVLEKVLVKEGRNIATYKELSDAIGRDVQQEARGLLFTARRLIQKQFKLVLEAVTNEGIQKTKDYEVAVDHDRKHISKIASRRTKVIYNALNGEDEIDPMLVIKLGTLNAAALVTHKKVPQKLLDTIEQRKLRELSASETIKLFGENK